MPDEIQRLVTWYRAQCDGDWEHQNGLRLETLDNPGWILHVRVADTSLAGRTVPKTSLERSEDDWVFYELANDVFRGACGPENLVEMLRVFLALAES